MTRISGDHMPAQPEREHKDPAPAEPEQAEKKKPEDAPLEEMASGMGNKDFSKMLGAEAQTGSGDLFGEKGSEGEEMLPHEATHTVQQGKK